MQITLDHLKAIIATRPFTRKEKRALAALDQEDLAELIRYARVLQAITPELN